MITSLFSRPSRNLKVKKRSGGVALSDRISQNCSTNNYPGHRFEHSSEGEEGNNFNKDFAIKQQTQRNQARAGVVRGEPVQTGPSLATLQQCQVPQLEGEVGPEDRENPVRDRSPVKNRMKTPRPPRATTAALEGPNYWSGLRKAMQMLDMNPSFRATLKAKLLSVQAKESDSIRPTIPASEDQIRMAMKGLTSLEAKAALHLSN